MSKETIDIDILLELLERQSPEASIKVDLIRKIYGEESKVIDKIIKKLRDTEWRERRAEAALLLMAEKLRELGYCADKYKRFCKCTEEEIDGGKFCADCLARCFKGKAVIEVMDKEKGV